MRIVFIHQSFPAQFGALAHHLRRLGHDVIAIREKRDGLARVPFGLVEYSLPENSSGSDVNSIAGRAAMRGVRIVQSLQILEKSAGKIDLIIGHNGWNELGNLPVEFPQIPYICYSEIMLAKVENEDPFVAEYTKQISDQETEVKGSWFTTSFLTSSIVHAAHAVTATEYQKNTHLGTLPYNLEVLHEGIDCEAIKPQEGVVLTLGDQEFSASDKILTFCTRSFEPTRCYHHLTKIIDNVVAEHPDVKICITGGMDTSEPYTASQFSSKEFKKHFLERDVAPHNRKNIFFMGMVPKKVLISLLQITRCHLFLTLDYVPSWSYLEAMATGAKVVAYDKKCLAGLPQGEDTEFVEFANLPRLTEAVNRALSQPQKSMATRKLNHQIVSESLDFETVIAPQWEAIINQVLGRGERTT